MVICNCKFPRKFPWSQGPPWDHTPPKLPLRQRRVWPSAALLGLVFVLLLVSATTAWADIPPPPLQRLTDPARAKILAALAALIILGFAMVLLTWLGARITQRYRHSAAYFQPTPRPGEHDWAKKPLPAPAAQNENKNTTDN